MSYLSFKPAQLTNPDFAMYREIIRSNRAGSYISTTLNGCNTRKYHGLLVCPVGELGGSKHVLLSSLHETVVQRGVSFNLGVQRYQGGHYDPKGHKYIQKFEVDRVPLTTFRVGGVVLNKERLLVEKEQQMLARYTLEQATSPTVLRLRPYVAFREIHQLSKANLYANTRYEEVNGGIRIRLYDGYPWLYLQMSSAAEFVAAPDWFFNIEYIKEKNRGYEYLEDLFTPGYFEVPILTGESVVFAAGTSEANPVSLKQRFTHEKNKRQVRDSLESSLKCAAVQFLHEQASGTDIVAGFPWYGSISRQTFVSLPGLLPAFSDRNIALKILDTYLPHLKDGLFPRSIAEPGPVFDDADAPLWFIWAVQQLKKSGFRSAQLWEKYGLTIKSIINNYSKGTRLINMLENGLLFAGNEGVALTWMNSYVAGNPVVPRYGKPVEINALWFNAVCVALEMSRTAGDKQFTEKYKKLPGKIGNAFIEAFWADDKGYLADVHTGLATDWTVRPNMVIAAAMPYTPLSIEQQKSIVSVAKDKLLTPRGLRTLSPEHPSFRRVITGNQTQREEAYHQGAVYPWLLQFFIEAYLRVHRKGGMPFIKKILDGFNDEMTEHCLGTLSEMYNGAPPYQAKGAVSQAWNVASLIRSLIIYKDYETS